MSAEPRISPVDANTAEGASKEIVDGNRSRWGKPSCHTSCTRAARRS
jgi:hypothetical protein